MSRAPKAASRNASAGGLLDCLSAGANGVHLRLRVAPGSSANRLQGLHGGALKVAVAAAPERGKANKAVCAFVAELLGIRKTAVQVVTGATSHDKTLCVAGLAPEEVTERLRAHLGVA